MKDIFDALCSLKSHKDAEQFLEEMLTSAEYNAVRVCAVYVFSENIADMVAVAKSGELIVVCEPVKPFILSFQLVEIIIYLSYEHYREGDKDYYGKDNVEAGDMGYEIMVEIVVYRLSAAAQVA